MFLNENPNLRTKKVGVLRRGGLSTLLSNKLSKRCSFPSTVSAKLEFLSLRVLARGENTFTS